jgi:Mg-chelatase subunit ChlD
VSSLAFGCAGGGDTSGDDRGGAGGGFTHATGGSGSITGSGGNAGFDNGAGMNDPGPRMPIDAGNAIPDGGECGATSLQAQQVVVQKEVVIETPVTTTKPVALYIMLDQSLSMGTSNLWDPAVSALNAFLSDAASNGVDVAIQYFPSDGDCSDGSGYNTPAVGIGRLPDHAQAIADSLGEHAPTGLGTPIEGALRGVTGFCKQFQSDNSDEKCVAVLVTDGKPELSLGCSSDHNTIAGIAGDAHSAGVTTFAVGLQGADFSLLDQIAMQGGAPDCDDGSAYACDVSDGAGKLVDALAKIRDTVTVVETHTETQTEVQDMPLPCEWQIPDPPKGQNFDRDKVNVHLTAPGTDLSFGKVSSADSCKAKGWHYDDPDAPTRIVACPETCDLIQSTPLANIQILLGCAAVLLE